MLLRTAEMCSCPEQAYDVWFPAQLLLEDGPTTYSLGDLRDATKLAQKIVQSYGMTDLGITMHAPKQHALGFMKRAFEVRASYKWNLLVPRGCLRDRSCGMLLQRPAVKGLCCTVHACRVLTLRYGPAGLHR